MKIVRMKKIKAQGTNDMFAVLCLVQSAAVILIIFTLFALTRINGDALTEIRGGLDVIFGTDLDMGGYFTPSENVSEENTTTMPAVQTMGLSAAASSGTAMVLDAENEEAEYEAVMPVNGTVTSDYGYREHPVYSGESFHSGRDIAADEGSDIYAVCDGTVTEAGEAQMAGLYVKIRHPDGRETLYCHCSKLLVSAGDSVSAGDRIALVGQTGLATGPHLHFELHENGETVDPEEILAGAVNVCQNW